MPHQLDMPLSVPLDNTPLHLKEGWVRDGQIYRGYYKTKDGAWPGKIVEKAGFFRAYIGDPPLSQTKHHRRGICFYHRRGDWYEVHLQEQPKDKKVDSVIFYVEVLLTESFELAKGVHP